MVYDTAIFILDFDPLPDPKYLVWILFNGCRNLITSLNLAF
jgi:hypothetical protein